MMKEKKEKSEKLEEKIDKLVEKIENEKSKTKRLAYIIKCKMLINKLEREINLRKVKEDFEASKEENNITAKEIKVVTRRNIIVLNKKIERLEKDLKANRRYNTASSDFMFPLGEVDNALRKANNIVSRKEMMVTAKSKFNIFAKIRNLASSIVYGVKEFRRESKEDREANKENVAKFEKLQSAYEAKRGNKKRI